MDAAGFEISEDKTNVILKGSDGTIMNVAPGFFHHISRLLRLPALPATKPGCQSCQSPNEFKPKKPDE